jgi:PAS domain S-box-containing protein
VREYPSILDCVRQFNDALSSSSVSREPKPHLRRNLADYWEPSVSIEDKDCGADAAGQPSKVHLRGPQPRNSPFLWKKPVAEDGPEPRDWLAAIIRGSDDAIISKDLNGIIQTWNDGVSRLFDYSADEVLGNALCLRADHLGAYVRIADITAEIGTVGCTAVARTLPSRGNEVAVELQLSR